MDIVIDTNIIRRDLKFADKNFDILLDYLSKTNSRIVMPRIVIEEIMGLYKRILVDRKNEYVNSLRKLDSLLIGKSISHEIGISTNNEVTKYIDYLKDKLRIRDESIIEYKPEYLNDIVTRAIARKKPCGDKGQQFRDGILWLTILDYAKSQPDRKLIFISDNPKDFSSGGNNELDPQLKEEASGLNIEIVYFKTISDFVREHAAKIDFITEEWIMKNVNDSTLTEMFNNVVVKEDKRILDKITGSLKHGKTITGYIQSTGYINSNLIDFYVYEMADGTLLLNLEFEFEKEYEFEYEEEVEKEESDFEYECHFNANTGDYDIEPAYVPRYRTRYEAKIDCECALFRGKFVITIKDKRVIDYDFEGWDWG